MSQAQVQKDSEGLFVEVEGIQYTSDDLPEEGTYVEVSSYMGIDDQPYADITWTADTPSGQGYCEGRER